MVIIAESGATKTDWRSIADGGQVVSVQTAGLNPVTMSGDSMREIIASAVPALNPDGRQVSNVFPEKLCRCWKALSECGARLLR